MKRIALLLKSKLLATVSILLSLGVLSNAEESQELISWDTKKLSADFYGEGAFYGPKLEFVLRDAIGRDWQCGAPLMAGPGCSEAWANTTGVLRSI